MLDSGEAVGKEVNGGKGVEVEANLDIFELLDGKRGRGTKRKREAENDSNIDILTEVKGKVVHIRHDRKRRKMIETHETESISSDDIALSDIIRQNKEKQNKNNKNNIIINSNQTNKFQCEVCKQRFSLYFLTQNRENVQSATELICQICRHKIANKIIVNDTVANNSDIEKSAANQKVSVNCCSEKCTNYIQTNFNTAQIKYCDITCITCNVDIDGSALNKIKYEWQCPRTECNNGPWLTLSGFIKHFERLKINHNCIQHQNIIAEI